MTSPTKRIFTHDEVLHRIPLLKRIVGDVVDANDRRRKARELYQEFQVIARNIRSPEIDETINNLRSEVKDLDAQIALVDKEIVDLGGILKDARKGHVYFYSERDGRKIFLVWEFSTPDQICWHELDETYADRMPLESPPLGTSSSSSYDRRRE